LCRRLSPKLSRGEVLLKVGVMKFGLKQTARNDAEINDDSAAERRVASDTDIQYTVRYTLLT